ncbi:hypothetical protein [Kineococcus terrestris]|uniref:hypothetical protein n=1 Tax=Kineococcus terrestris TaxID=2044856 RepID=UPI0034DB2197
MPTNRDDGSGPLDVDAAFAEIVAHWGDEDAGHGARADAAPDADPAAGPAAARAAGGEGAPARPGTPAEEGDQPRAAGGEVPGALRDSAPGAPDAGARETAAERGARTVRPARPLPPAPREDVPGAAVPGRAPGGAAEEPRGRRERDREPLELGDGLSDRFVPAEPAPLPRDLVGWAAWAAVVGAPLFLLVVALTSRGVPALVTVLTALVFVGGFATLVVRLPRSRDDDEDDGAVV